MVHNIRITFGAQMQPQIVIWQGDYNSRTIQALCYTSSGGAMSFDGQTVSVVYSISGTVSAEYPVQVTGNVLSFTMPGLASASVGAGSMQVRIYGSESLLQSAIIPYVVKASLDPGPAEEDQVPMLVMLVQQAQQAIAGANAAASTANQVAQIANTAANLASEKAGLAQNAASSANEAATNATNSAELAQTAADNANSASESANSAAGTANNAADNANSAAESANNAATNANQVADEIQQKADSGAFNGKDGLNAPQIDDAQITTTNPWSSMQIVNTLCPPFAVSGAIVQCTPVANYPLSVQASWGPRQEGSGDPSPDNIRPITGVDSVQVTRCGKNLFEATQNTFSGSGSQDNILASDQTTSMLLEELGNDQYVFAFDLETHNLVFADDDDDSRKRIGIEGYAIRTDGTHVYVASWATVENGKLSANTTARIVSVWQGEAGEYISTKPMYLYAQNIVSGTWSVSNIQLEFGSTATPYEPYTGSAAMLTLPETIYGGTVDAVTGVGVETVHGVKLNGTEAWTQRMAGSSGMSYFECFFTDSVGLFPSSGGSIGPAKRSQKISHFKIGNPYSENVDDAGWVYNVATSIYATARIRASRFENVEDWKSYLAAQAAAGTPVTIAYKLATPTPFQATGGQSILALPGTNTIYTDADSVTVTGRADPIATITALQTRVSALESAHTEM